MDREKLPSAATQNRGFLAEAKGDQATLSTETPSGRDPKKPRTTISFSPRGFMRATLQCTFSLRLP